MTYLILVLLMVAAIFAVAALAGTAWLIIRREPDPEPPSWVNHGAHRQDCQR